MAAPMTSLTFFFTFSLALLEMNLLILAYLIELP